MSVVKPENPASEPEISRNQQGGRFQKGQSGNPAGRAPGSRNKATLIREAALTERAVGLLNGLMEKAEAGDLPATRIVLKRVLPTACSGIELPPGKSALEIAETLGVVAEATASGEITPAQANALTRTLQAQLDALRVVDEQRQLIAKVQMEQALREGFDGCLEIALAEQEEEAADALARGEPPPRPTIFPAPPLGKYMALEDWLEATGMAGRLGWVPPRRWGLLSSAARVRENRGSPH